MKPIQCLCCLCLMLFAQTFARAQRPELVVQTGHSNRINEVAFTTDGKTMASGGWDGLIKLWDVEAETEIRSIAWPTQSVIQAVAFSPNGKVLAVGADDGLRLWDAATGQELHVLTGHTGVVDVVRFSPDGNTLASSSWGKWTQPGDPDKGSTRLWDVETGKPLSVINGFSLALSFSPDGKALAVIDSDNTIKLCDVNTGAVLKTLRGHTGLVLSLAYGSDGKTLVSGGRDGTVRLWDTETGNELKSRSLPLSADHFLWFSQDGKLMASGKLREEAGNTADAIQLWNVETGTELSHLSKCSPLLKPLGFSPDNKIFAGACGNERTIGLWDVNTGVQLSALSSHTVNFRACKFSRDGKSLAVADWDQNINLWHVDSGRTIRTIRPPFTKPLTEIKHSSFVAMTLQVPSESFDFSPDGNVFARVGKDNLIQTWDIGTGKESKALEGHACEVTSLSFSPDGRTLASGSCDKSIKLWDTATGKELRSLEGHNAEVTSVSFSPRGDLLASGSGVEDRTIKLWDVATGRLVKTLGEEPFYVASVSFDAEGKTVASIGYSSITYAMNGAIVASLGPRTLSRWDVDSGKLLERTVLDSVEKIFGAANAFPRFYGDFGMAASERLLAVGGDKVAVRVYDRQTQADLLSLIDIDESDWLAVTPEGLFDGSPNAWKRINWRFNNNSFEYAPVEAFFKEFYYPGLLKEISDGKRPAPPVKDLSEIDIRQPLVQIALIGGQVPQRRPLGRPAVLASAIGKRHITVEMQITDNTDAPRQGAKSGLQATAASSGGRDLRLFRNGSLVKVWKGDVFGERTDCRQLSVSKGDPRRAICRADLQVVAGRNEFAAYAFNSENVKSRDVSVLAEGAESLKRPSTLYILTVGVNQYANARYSLLYAVSDAQNLAAEVKRQQELVKPEQKVEIIPLLNSKATKANILSTLSELVRKAQPEDSVIVYFSGHGTTAGNRFYLIPHDLGYEGPRERLDEAGLQAILRHSISDQELEAAFEKLDSGQILLLIDTCNSGQALDAEERRRGPMNSKGLAQLAYEKGMYVLTASQSAELAFESETLKHSYMSYALVEEGLKSSLGETDSNDDGQIWAKEWFDYAARRVPRLRRERVARTGSRPGKSLEIVEATDQDKVQTPRVFYRGESNARPWVVARVR